MGMTSRLRSLALLVHRYVGLLMSVFLLVAGVTGSIIAFYPQIDRFINPELLAVEPPRPGAPLLDPWVVRDRLLEQLPRGQAVDEVILYRTPGLPFNYWLDEREVFVDPYTGKIRGSRHFGDLSEGRVNWVTFLYELHFTLGLGEVGRVLFGVVALLWTFDCFVGVYLTFPPPRREPARRLQRTWLVRWVPSWLLRTGKLFAVVFTWHRASGLWLWAAFLVFAWSAVALNLREEVYQPVMNGVFGEDEAEREMLAHRAGHHDRGRLELRSAYALARRASVELSNRHRFSIFNERALSYDDERGVYVYCIESSRDVAARLAETYIYLDGADGQVLGWDAPTGKHAGTTITSWLIGVHFGALRVGGLAYRWCVCLLGLVVVLLSATGVWIWWKKRQLRLRSTRRRQLMAAVPAEEPFMN